MREPWGGVRMAESVEPFRQVEIPGAANEMLRQENEVLRAENARIKEVIEKSIQEAISTMTSQFNHYLAQITQHVQFQQKAPNTASKPNSPRERHSSMDKRSDSLKISQSGGGYSFDLRPVEDGDLSRSSNLPIIREKRDSTIRIDLS